MIGTWASLLAGASFIWFWMDGLRARELAVRHGMTLCHEAGMQLLDQTVSLRRVRVARRDGLPTVIRRYGFEVSLNGSDRHRGHLDLSGHRLESWSLPLVDNAAAGVVPQRPDPLRLVRSDHE